MMKIPYRTMDIERAVKGSLRRIERRYYALVFSGQEKAWLEGRLSENAALQLAANKRGVPALGLDDEIRLASGMTQTHSRGRPLRVWAVVPEGFDAGVPCTVRRALSARHWWNKADDVRFETEPLDETVEILRDRFRNILYELLAEGRDFMPPDVARFLDDEKRLAKIGLQQDWILLVMRHWAHAAAKKEGTL